LRGAGGRANGFCFGALGFSEGMGLDPEAKGLLENGFVLVFLGSCDDPEVPAASELSF